MLDSINNLARDERLMKAKAEELKAKSHGISKSEKKKSRHNFSEKQQQQLLSMATPPVRRLCPFDEDSEDEDEEKKDSMEEDPPASTTPPGSPLRPSDENQNPDNSAGSQRSGAAQNPSVQQVRAPIIIPIFLPTPAAVIDSVAVPVSTPSLSAPTASAVGQTKSTDVVDGLPVSRLRIGKARAKNPTSREKVDTKLEKRKGITKPVKTTTEMAKKTAAKVANRVERALYQKTVTADQIRDLIRKGRGEKPESAIDCSST